MSPIFIPGGRRRRVGLQSLQIWLDEIQARQGKFSRRPWAASLGVRHKTRVWPWSVFGDLEEPQGRLVHSFQYMFIFESNSSLSLFYAFTSSTENNDNYRQYSLFIHSLTQIFQKLYETGIPTGPF